MDLGIKVIEKLLSIEFEKSFFSVKERIRKAFLVQTLNTFLSTLLAISTFSLGTLILINTNAPHALLQPLLILSASMSFICLGSLSYFHRKSYWHQAQPNSRQGLQDIGAVIKSLLDKYGEVTNTPSSDHNNERLKKIEDSLEAVADALESLNTKQPKNGQKKTVASDYHYH